MKKIIDMLKNKFGTDDEPSGGAASSSGGAGGGPPPSAGASSAPPPRGPAPSTMDVSCFTIGIWMLPVFSFNNSCSISHLLVNPMFAVKSS